ncbi:MAG: glycoside hydrolase family 38 C-terminal domain-containing protein [Candidatus Cloacimonadaceae bacterium]|jgi:alpha-mannosidase|nr:glycosyl hydrolase-related protein [Candidatus Cloacimonadota bacterium]MDY0126727.1 glycoside hydrolase family 38 C-terminal domain-containing protein [Candidatus Cloacimonadaceae bacterium]MCB5255503.1 glycosyl hydrolase-related protein [Candidatus Cloacimonadota bacterium]MCK9178064.1 glycosyl hydrolase-related protein [Candidatus Cloacimonadota bacterium]MCK9241999.1 glycosyl hydrolase-related protein [Candidatus Cloacimonadota bacterium]
MQNEKIHLERITRFIQRQKDALYIQFKPLQMQYIHDPEPIPWQAAQSATWQDIKCGDVWSEVWGSAWFKVCGRLSDQHPASQQGLHFDCEGEACVTIGGKPWQGLTPKVDWYHNAAKHYVPLADIADAEGNFELFIEAAANDLFGAGKQQYRLAVCALSLFDEELYQFALDLELLNDLAVALPQSSVRRAKIIYGLNEICNVWGCDADKAFAIAKKLLDRPAEASALKAYSIGHAHLDLAWLWPIRESKRKGGRTFANALRLLERYPDYIFGASQAQLYQWIKQDYPALYKEVQDAVKQGRWEVQGASWVEFDTNLPCGESLIRQFSYGRGFFDQEFGIVPNYLWLPDCFGFSGNLPQIMKGCKVDYFITQKLSWNESNVFDKHLFIWQGIDGSQVRAHQLPTNDYNFSNSPSAFLATQGRFAQAELAEGFLNLYGIGDGGGGPTRNHIEYGLRQQDLEGSPKFIFSKAADFFEEFARIPEDKLPKCYTELYLEFHRGTYTTQARMKKDNLQSERLLHAAEWIAVLRAMAGGRLEYPALLHPIWKDTLLLQFHDILPGSSISQVYSDAHELSSKNHAALQSYIRNSLISEPHELTYSIFNPAPAAVQRWLSFPLAYRDYAAFLDQGEIPYAIRDEQELKLLLRLEPYSKGSLSFLAQYSPLLNERQEIVPDGDGYLLKGSHLQVKISPRGSLLSMVCGGIEFLEGESNLVQLWEDEPNNWGAWDINHFYRETTPQEAAEASVTEAFSLGDYARIVHEIKIGKSTIKQVIELMPEAKHLIIHHEVDWQEHHRMLRVAFCTNVFSQKVDCGIQMGLLSRSARPQNAWEAARFDFPAQGFVAQSEPGRTCALLAASKYGYSAHENRLELALLRSPADVDPQADIGPQSYSYGFFCDACDFTEAPLASLSQSIEAELILTEGRSPLQPLDLHFAHNALILNIIKPAESGKAIILRLHEPLGRHCVESIFTLLPIAQIYKCNMLEEPEQEIFMNREFSVKPFEIITLRLELKDDPLPA